MISVCMATYNGEKFLREQVDSILAQLTSEDELVVSDDGSTDKTIGILESYNDSRIKIFHNQNNHGVNGNFENALRHAAGDYIFLSDQDDVWLPNKVTTCKNALATADCIIHDCILVDSRLNTINPSFFLYHNSTEGFWRNLYRNSYVGCCMAFKRHILDTALPYPNEIPVFQEGWIASIAAWKWNVKFITEKCILFRRHDATESTTGRKSQLSFYRKVFNRIKLLFLVLRRIYADK